MTRIEALMHTAAGTLTALPDEPDDADTPVPGEGPLDARLVVIGESLGADEWEQRRLFVGRSGHKLRNHARLAGVNLRQARIDVVMPLFTPGGSIANVHKETLRDWQEDCRERVRAMSQRALIVAVGNAALETFTGLRESTRRRGSLYEWEGTRVLAMIHPAVAMKRKEYEKHCRLDWERVKLLTTPHETHHTTCGCAVKQERTHITPYTVSAEALVRGWKAFCAQAQCPTNIMAVDVETPKIKGERRLLCISFAFDPHTSLVLPFTDTYRPWIDALCRAPCIKLGHNFISYDRWWLEREGVHVVGEIRDTLCLSHALDPASAHSLEFLTSRYTWEPWYKDEGKGHDIALIERDLPGYYAYCGLDSLVTRELHDIVWSQLEARGLVAFYRKHYEALFDPLLDLSLRGVRIDHEARRHVLTESLHVARFARDALGALAGKSLFTLGTKRDEAVYAAMRDDDPSAFAALALRYGSEACAVSVDRVMSKTVSSVQLKELLYTQLGLPVQLKRRSNGEYTATADAVTLRQLRRQYGEERPEVQSILDLAMKHNKAQKLASFCYENHFDIDGRFRFSVKVNTEAARLASSAAPNGRGGNSQNSPRVKGYRRIFLPEPGHVLLSFDLSNVEGRFCFFYTNDCALMRLAQLRSSEYDDHTEVALLVGLAPDRQSVRRSVERQIAKAINHGAQRDMQGMRLSEMLMKEALDADGNWNEDFIKSVEECDTIIERYRRARPAIAAWHQRVRREMRTTGRLMSPSGRCWDVRYEEMNDDLFRRGYSWILQRSCAELMNQQGFIPLWYWLKNNKMESRILLHEHDELVCSCPVSEVFDVALFARDHLEEEVSGLRIPVEFSLGRSWAKEGEEWSELPSRDEMEKVALSLV